MGYRGQGGGAASDIIVTPTGNIDATDLQSALAEMAAEFQLVSEKDQPNGYLSLDENGHAVGTYRITGGNYADFEGIAPALDQLIHIRDHGIVAIGDGVTVRGVPISALRSQSALIVQATGTPAENAAALQAAYEKAKTLTPYGNARSATNRVTLFLTPGVYDFGAGDGTNNGWRLNGSYIDVVGLGRPADVLLTCQRPVIAQRSLIWHDSISEIANLTLQNTYTDATTVDLLAASGLYRPNGNSQQKLTDIIFDIPNVTGNAIVCMQPYGANYSGTYTRLAIGTIGSSYGLFAWEGTNRASAATIGGTHYDCTSPNKSIYRLGAISAQMYRCSGGNDSFQVIGTNAISGQLFDCKASVRSFGPKIWGTLTRCEASDQSFCFINGGDATGGNLRECEILVMTAPTANSIVLSNTKFERCRIRWLAGGDGITSTNAGGLWMYQCMVHSDGTYAYGSAANAGVRIVGCVSNKPFRNDAGQILTDATSNIVDANFALYIP